MVRGEGGIRKMDEGKGIRERERDKEKGKRIGKRGEGGKGGMEGEMERLGGREEERE